MSYKRLSSLWKHTDHEYQTISHTNSFVQSNHHLEHLQQKSIEDICIKAELAETNWDYAYSICEGMKNLFEMGVPAGRIIAHDNLMHKLLYLGIDIMQASARDSIDPKNNDMFYLGVFIEIKIYSMWKVIKFYKFIINALKAIKRKMKFISQSLKKKLLLKLKQLNLEIYQQYLTESLIDYKDSA